MPPATAAAPAKEPAAVAFKAPSPQPSPLPRPAEAVVERPRIAIKPTSAIPSIIPNLNDLSGGETKTEEEGPTYISGDSRRPFSANDFLREWNKYAEEIKKQGKINLFTLMTSNPPALLDNYQVEVIIENKIQEGQLSIEKIDLLNHLRVTLQNFSIDIIGRQVEKNEKKKLYTSSEKYQFMAEKNPKLEEFRRKFNLNVE